MVTPFSALGTQQTGLGRQGHTLRGSKSSRRDPPTNKVHKWDNFSNDKSNEDNKTGCDSEWYNWGPLTFLEGLPIPQTSPAVAQSPLALGMQPLHTPPHPLLCEHHGGGGLGAGAFRWGFSRAGFPQLPLELPEGHWPRHWTLSRPPSPPPPRRRRANLSTPGTVPGNSSISLSPRRLQETETQAPPLRSGLAEPGWGPRPELGR